jgi:hypothetical protein
MAVKGVPLAMIAVGAILVWSGLFNKKITETVQDLVQGKKPVPGPMANYGGSGGSGGSGDSARSGDTSAHSNTARVNQGIARLMLSGSHPDWLVGKQWDDLVSLWNQESGWDNLAMNKSSGAFGIPQALGHGLSNTAGKYGNQYPSRAANDGVATAQIAWGIGYIAERYHNPSAAWAHEVANNWY